MKPYLTYTPEDLACDEDFLNWVKHPERYPDLEAFWRGWLSQHPEKQELVDEARCLLLAVLADDQFVPDGMKEKDIWNRIQVSTGLENMRTIVPLWRQWYSRAAVFLLILSMAWWIDERHSDRVMAEQVQMADIQSVKHVNNAELPQTIILGDGSSILLQPNAILEYPKMFAADIREVSLKGEAFFQVTRDPDKPFLVQSGEVTTRVLGTSFSVRNVEGENSVLIQVRTGKVSVFMTTEKSEPSSFSDQNVAGVVLMPNQQVLYERTAMKMTKSLVENPSVLVPPRRENFEFADTPIKDVFKAIEEAYGVEIVFDEEALASCYLNASLHDVALYDKLKLICMAINARYEIMDSHIIVYGKGCREDNETKTQ